MNTPVPFRGSAMALATQMSVAVFPTALAVCLLFFGSLGWRLFAVSLLLAPVLFGVAWLISRMDRIEFNDAERLIVRRWRKPVYYADIDSVRMLRSVGATQVSATKKKGGAEVLSLGLRTADEPRLREIIAKRCSGVAIVSRTYASWKITAVVIVIMLAIYAGGMYLIRREAPVTHVACELLPAANVTAGSVIRRSDGMEIHVPKGFEEARFRVVSTGQFSQVGMAGRWFLRMAGIDSEYGLFQYATCARQGLIPMVLKTALLGQWEDVEVFESISGPQRRLAIVGERNGAGEASVLVLNADQGVEAVIAIRMENLTRNDLRNMLGAVTLERSEGV